MHLCIRGITLGLFSGIILFDSLVASMALVWCGLQCIKNRVHHNFLLAVVAGCCLGLARMSWQMQRRLQTQHKIEKTGSISGEVIATKPLFKRHSQLILISANGVSIRLLSHIPHVLQIGDYVHASSVSLIYPTDHVTQLSARLNTYGQLTKIAHSSGFFFWLSRIRKKIVQRTCAHLSPYAQVLMRTLFFGERCAASRELSHLTAACVPWGISHFLSRSGGHLSLIAAAAYCMTAPLLLFWSGTPVLCALLLIAYAIFSFPTLSFLRATGMLCIYAFGYVRKRPTCAGHSLIIMLFLSLLSDPYIVYQPGFQLTFGITAALVWRQKIMQSVAYAKA